MNVKFKFNKFYSFFWILAIGTSIFLALSICFDQWNRFEENPTIVSYEIDFRSWKYDHTCGITVCSDYVNPEIADKLIRE